MGAIGTAVMQSSMRSVLSFLDSPQLNSPEVYLAFNQEDFDVEGNVLNHSTSEFLKHYMGEYAGFVARVLDANAEGHIGDLNPQHG